MLPPKVPTAPLSQDQLLQIRMNLWGSSDLSGEREDNLPDDNGF